VVTPDQRGAWLGWRVPAHATTRRWKFTKKNTSEAITSLKKQWDLRKRSQNDLKTNSKLAPHERRKRGIRAGKTTLWENELKLWSCQAMGKRDTLSARED
jgi:hypothetical protein